MPLGSSQIPAPDVVAVSVVAAIKIYLFYSNILYRTYLKLYILGNPHFFNFAPKIVRRLQNVSEGAHFDRGTYIEQGNLKMSL